MIRLNSDAELVAVIKEGLYPAEYEELAQLICDICYNNAKNFFGFELN